MWAVSIGLMNEEASLGAGMLADAVAVISSYHELRLDASYNEN
ncbi:hypothetical protein J2Z65_002237 [Paenibacillus aceris]|uniref:Uncharacterized protein n=1 Tax=Paenibacillus aceris TaxID=869555 RepID=A0ABS4HXT9_9BACL|nr:hypothetical protein [Paenibacillus aceris]